MEQDQALASASLAFAMTQVGKRESTGHNDGPYIDMLHAWFGTPNKGEPWCAMFCTWCIYHAADATVPYKKPVIRKSESSSDLYDQAKKQELLLAGPINGCIGLLKGSGGFDDGRSHHHTFRVISVDSSQGIVYSVDGNWGNAVSTTTHRIFDCDFMAVA